MESLESLESLNLSHPHSEQLRFVTRTLTRMDGRVWLPTERSARALKA